MLIVAGGVAHRFRSFAGFCCFRLAAGDRFSALHATQLHHHHMGISGIAAEKFLPFGFRKPPVFTPRLRNQAGIIVAHSFLFFRGDFGFAVFKHFLLLHSFRFLELFHGFVHEFIKIFKHN